MASEELSLNWNDHHKTLVAVFEKLLEQSTLVDCTIAAEGQYVKAHKVILSACSPYFELLFSQENEKNPIIILKDIKFRELKAMIDFVYRGSVKIPQDRLQDFVDAAESLQIKGLGVDQKKNNPGKRTNNFENDNRKKDEFLSQPKKRVKSSSSNKSEENSPYVPPEGVKVSKNIMSGSRSFHQIERSVAKTSSSFTHSVSDTPAFVNVGQESRSSTEENFPCSTEQQSDLETVSQSGLSVSEPPEFVNVGQESHSSMEEKVPCPTEQPVVFTEAASMFAESGDVKTEPESKCVPEVIVPDRLLEPKKEECEEEITILDSEEEADESLDADGIHDGNSQHLSSFPPTQESILGTSDSYALEQMDHSNTQGGDVSNSSGWQDLHSPLEVEENVFVTSVKEISSETREDEDTIRIICSQSANFSPAGGSTLSNSNAPPTPPKRSMYQSARRRYYADQSAASSLTEGRNVRNEYNYRGEAVPKRNVGDLCDKSCRFYCMDRFSDHERKCLFHAFSSLDEGGKNSFLLSLMQPSECKKTHSNPERKRNRSISYRYSVPSGNQRKVLCKSAVINMFHISRAKLDMLRDKVTYSFLSKKDGTSRVSKM